MFKRIILNSLLFFCVCPVAFSWNNTGHQIIAAIAYKNLNPETKKVMDDLTRYLFNSPYGDTRFLLASAWPDIIRNRGVRAFDTWHFIDLPYSPDGTKTLPPERENVVWAITQSQNVLTSRNAYQPEKAWFLNFLIHFVGDVHQPLHCVERYDHQFPNGDAGGNFFLIQSPVANDLHTFWDRGAGMFSPRMRFRAVQNLADKIMQEYPQESLKNLINIQDPHVWAQESYELAKTQVYSTPINAAPSDAYVQKSQVIIKKQLALAGYRLAHLLNNLCQNPASCRPNNAP